MKIPKERIAVGILLLSATVGLSGCTAIKGRNDMYTAYGVVSPVTHLITEHVRESETLDETATAENGTIEESTSDSSDA